VAVDRLGSVRWNAARGGHTYYPYAVEYSATANDTEKYATYTRGTLTTLDYAMKRRRCGARSRRAVSALLRTFVVLLPPHRPPLTNRARAVSNPRG
jgi:hypothetical protein